MTSSILAWGMPGTTELIIIAVIALLIFGRRLPDVARSIGKSIVEFKKGVRDVKDEIDVRPSIEQTANSASSARLENKVEPTKNASPTGEAIPAKESEPPQESSTASN